MVTGAVKELQTKHGTELKDCRAMIFVGTGPVGIATGVIAALRGADALLIDHLSIDTALEKANEYNRLCGTSLRGTYASSEADKVRLLADADVVFCTAKAGIQILSASVLADAKKIKVAGDVNAAPPLGIEGVELRDFGIPLKYATGIEGAVGIGALTIGDVKYKLQQTLLATLREEDKHPVYLDFRDAFKKARHLV